MEEQDDGSAKERKTPSIKGRSVFEVEQIEGPPEHVQARSEPITDSAQRTEHAQEFFAATEAGIRHGGHRARYSGGTDHVQMSHFESFHSLEYSYATLAYELIRSAANGESTHCAKRPKAKAAGSFRSAMMGRS